MDASTPSIIMSMVRKYESDEERQAARREAVFRYNHSAKGKANQARRDPEKAKAAQARYRETEGYQAAQDRFKASGGRNRLAKAHRDTVKAERPELIEAWAVIQAALKSGVLVRPDKCEGCERTVHLVAHHYLGYGPEHQIDVQWLCRKCHRKAH